MKYLSFKIIAACIILSPVCYILTLHILENRLHDRYARQVQAVLLGEAEALLSGKDRLKAVVPRNWEGDFPSLPGRYIRLFPCTIGP